MDGPRATYATYERNGATAPWTQTSSAQPAVVGSKGLAWGLRFQSAARGGEPLKVEGDRRTPAGIYALGPTFGFEPATYTGHLLLQKDQHLCVDDVNSPYYSRIVSREIAGAEAHGEEMWTVRSYKRGLVVDYPTDREVRAGSCIFVHIWQGEDQGTSGCVAAPEEDVAALQDLSAKGDAFIAILPKSSKERFAGCLP